MNVLTETHLHTEEISGCGWCSAKKIPAMYAIAGYKKIIVTDHFNDYTLDGFGGKWKKKIKEWVKGYEILAEYGAKYGIDVFLGMELRLNGCDEDYLIYGITREFLNEHPFIYEKELPELYKIINDNNMLIYQAHPFRVFMTPQEPAFLHGIEVYNGNPRHESNNDMAYDYAQKHNLRMIAGGDFHRSEDVARAGIYLPEEIKTNAELVRYLKHNEVKLYIPC